MAIRYLLETPREVIGAPFAYGGAVTQTTGRTTIRERRSTSPECPQWTIAKVLGRDLRCAWARTCRAHTVPAVLTNTGDAWGASRDSAQLVQACCGGLHRRAGASSAQGTARTGG